MIRQKTKSTRAWSERIKEYIRDNYPDEAHNILLPTGLENAFIGTTQRDGKTVAVFDENLCVALLSCNMNCSMDEAREFFDYNVVGAHVGDYTPIFVTKPTL